ncbi:efflux RND transporter permease subunit [Parabacteroides sp. PF5-9]|uniref:efflux RND transporter permease subunit n=1 Tax=Parabacteroides sp. PF5-9 TaxID=1742404 RepID=UPI002474BEEC|nr:efflux RND transporter permease subunit [Parabacteroides sp. PF5-9]MDH6356163.1 multidrug efflux pump subunit AcrB [Parabacteroides sp. PF5-9]
MIDVSRWALNNKKLIYFLIAVLVVGGVLSFYDMSKLEDPEIRVKQAMVITTYPGASAHQVELEVTDLLEKSIRSMPNVDNVQSRSMNDVSMITVELVTTVGNEEIEQHWDMLRRKVSDVQAQLPDGAGTSQVKDDFGDVYGMFFAITSDGFSDRELNDYAELAKRELLDIAGISRVEIYGKRNECIHIEMFQDQMANLGVHPAEVLSTLNGQNQIIYSGYYESDFKRLRVSVNDRYKEVKDIENLILQGHEEDQLRLKDIARITLDYEDPVRNEFRYDGLKALGISISAQSGTDVTKLGQLVETRLEEIKETRIPAGIAFHKVFFQPDRVSTAINTFLLNLVESVFIVILVLIFTMGFKSGLIIGISLVIIVFGSFLVLNMFDGTLQRVSLASFVLAMGMLVDNAIVIVDGILVDLKRGLSRQEALTNIGRKTAIPLLGATIIAILAFFPIFLSPDTAGIYVHDLFIVLAVSLLLSWILALTQVPINADRMLRPQSDGINADPYGSKYYQVLRRVLFWSLRHKTMTILAAVALVAASAFCYRFLPQGFFPDLDYDQLYIEYKLPEGSNSTQVKAELAAIEHYLLKRDDVTHVATSIGGTPSRYNLVRSIADPSLSYGELIVDYVSSKALVASIDEIQEYLTANYPEAYVRIKRYNLMYKKYPIEVQFNGPDPAVLKELTAQAEAIMLEAPGTLLVRNDWEPESPVLMIDYNQPVARNIGLSRSDVGLSVLSATGGIPVTTFYEGQYSRTIYLKCVDADGRPVESLENTPVFSMIPPLQQLDKQTMQGLITGSLSEEDLLESMLRTIPLSQATNGIRLIWEDPVVVRYNGQRAMRAQCNTLSGYGAEEVRQSILKQVEAIPLPTGYSLQWEGESKASGQATKYLFANFPLAIILMIAILIMLFKDYRKPAIIFCCIPLVCIGVVGAMLLSGKTFGFVAIVGVLGLIGMMVKNGIVLMDEIHLQLTSGVEPVKALLDSSSSRFRPVMMASLTTILGMIPLISDDMFGSLAVTIMGGLLVGTLIILLFIPVLYAVFFGIHVQSDKE